MSTRSDVVPLTIDACTMECIHPDAINPLIGQLIAPEAADRLALTFSTLADQTRVRLLHALSMADELCVCDLALLLALSESAVSHQLRLLRERGVVVRRKAGRIVYYRLADEHIRRLFDQGLRHSTEQSSAAVTA